MNERNKIRREITRCQRARVKSRQIYVINTGKNLKNRPGKPGIIREFSVPGKNRELYGNFRTKTGIW